MNTARGVLVEVACEDLGVLVLWSVVTGLRYSTMAPGPLVPCLGRVLTLLDVEVLHKIQAVLREDWLLALDGLPWKELAAAVANELLRRVPAGTCVVTEDDGEPDAPHMESE